MPFALKPASPDDIPAFMQLGDTTFEPDAHTRLKSQYGYNHAEVMTGVFKDWLSRPPTRTRVVKAVDDDTGEILGWVVWGYRGYDGAHQTPNKVSGRAFESKSDSGENTGIARLEDMTSADMQRWMEFFMPEGTKCMFIQSISVAPAHQGKGIGTALIEYGTSQADRDGVFCWVHSSEAGFNAFAKAGFEEIGRLDIDLNEFAREEEAKQQSRLDHTEHAGDMSTEPQSTMNTYGRYVFRYMQRPAQAKR